ncbi:MAG: helix-turn-helix domain-containing protein [Acidithiobacillus sp.]|nr:helix-turn-helix domain-containing protein [Acidithiobacillus sp.]
MTYYETRRVIDAEISKRKREHRETMMRSAQELAQHGASRHEIATILGKSAETIRRWLQVHNAPIRARGSSLTR